VLRSKKEWHHVKLLNGMSGWVSAEYVSHSGEPSVGQASAPAKDDEVISPERQEHQRQVIDRANALLDAVVVFLKLHPDLPEIASVAQEVSKLQLALGDEDVAQVEASTQSLKALMDKVPEFKESQEARAKEIKEAQIRALGDAVRLASKHVMFLRGQIAGHVTSPSTPALATLLREYEGALRNPDLPTLTGLNDRLKQLVSEQRLTDAYE
jgi:hypothetical protein